MAVVLEPVGRGDDRLYGVILNENEIHFLCLMLEETLCSCANKHIPGFYETIDEVIDGSKFELNREDSHIGFTLRDS